VQFEKAFVVILFTPVSTLTISKLSVIPSDDAVTDGLYIHFIKTLESNASSPMCVILFGIVIGSVNAQFLKALLPILVTVLGILINFKPEHP